MGSCITIDYKNTVYLAFRGVKSALRGHPSSR